MKIICVDNFNRESVDDRLIASNVNEFYAKTIVVALNDKFGGPSSADFFRAVPDDYKLHEFAP